jgi:hypothetical protein
MKDRKDRTEQTEQTERPPRVKDPDVVSFHRIRLGTTKLSYLVGSKFSYAYVHMMMNDLPYFQVIQLKVISVKMLLAQTCLAAGL